jgi:uncharacterized protein (TIGR03437 family)
MGKRSYADLLTALLAVTFAAHFAHAQGYTITTVAGGGTSIPPGPAIGALVVPAGAAVDAAGNVYASDHAVHVVYKVSRSGNISIFAGTIQGFGYSGDGGPATSAELDIPAGLAFDAAGNLYIADSGNGRVRKVATDGTITTVAGGGPPQNAPFGDGGQAAAAYLAQPWGVAVDSSGNLFISDVSAINLVRKVSPDGIITTVAGQPFAINLGDGGPATSALLGRPRGLAVDGAGNLYIADTVNNRIRKVSNGIITTVAGSGSGSYSGDGGAATSAGISGPQDVKVDAAGNIFIADTEDDRVRMVTPAGTITTIAGTGQIGHSGDSGPATNATLAYPTSIAFGTSGAVYVADQGRNETDALGDSRVRLLSPVGSQAGSPPSIKSGGVVSASAFGGFSSIAPGSWIEIYGSNLATDSRGWAGTDFSGVNAPTSLDGTKVTVGGQPAFIDYISPGQVNAQVPSNAPTGNQPVVVTTAAGASSAYAVTVNAEQPGLLAPSTFSTGGKQYAVALFSDGTTYVLPPGAISGVPSRRAQPGDSITLYGIGFGPVTPSISAGQVVQQTNALASPFHLFFGGTEAMVSYSGLAPNAVGLYQFNVIVPNVASGDTIPLTFNLAGVSGTQTIYIAVQNGALASQLQSLTLSASQIAGGGTLQGMVTLSAPAPSGGAVVGLSSSSSAASVPATVTIPAGSTSATFAVSAAVVTSNQAVTITASYAGASMQAPLMVLPPAKALFSSLMTALTFAPIGSPSGQFPLTITPDSGNETYTATSGIGILFVNGTLSNQNQTFTFNAIQPGAIGVADFIWGATSLKASSASLSLTLHQTGPAGVLLGTISGTLTITGTPYPAGGNSVTLSGTVQGSYSAIP